MKGRDLFLLFICASVIWFYLPSSSTVSIVQKWKIPFSNAEFKNSHYPEDWEKIPPPLITDVNGDGLKDIVFVNTEYELAIADSESIQELGAEFGDLVIYSTFRQNAHLRIQNPELKPTYKASLLPEFGIKFGRRPVALASGYIDPPETAKRKKVIVVLTDGWTVVCYDHKLNFMWESQAREELEPDLLFQEATIYINPTPVTNGDRGLVVVGGRRTSQETIAEAVHEHFEKKDFFLSEEDLKNYKEKVEQERLDREFENLFDKPQIEPEKDHFSYYAFEGKTGDFRWKHEPGDWKASTAYSRNPETLLDVFSQATTATGTDDPALRLFLFHNMRHLGEADWTAFEDDIREHLPFIWRVREDTKMFGAHFERERHAGRAESSELDLDDRWQPHGVNELKKLFNFKPHEEPENPNVLVVHNLNGIEVIHYYSGRPLCKLELTPEMLYDDINNDGVIDHIETISERIPHLPIGSKNAATSTIPLKCIVVANSGIPTVEKLYETQVCSSSFFTRFKLGVDPSKSSTGDVDFAHPAAIKKPNGYTDLLFLVSNGRVACVKPNGDVKWVRDTDVQWSKKGSSTQQSIPSQASRYARVESFLEMGGFPSIEPFSLYGAPEYAAAVGYNALALINADTGAIESETRLPTIVNGPIIIGDWDNDGDNDIIVPCINGYVGLRITRGGGTPIYSVLFGLIIFTIPTLYMLNQPSKPKSKPNKMPDPYGMYKN